MSANIGFGSANINIGYYTGSRSIRLDIFTSLMYFVSSCGLDKIERRVKIYSRTELHYLCNKLFIIQQINQGKNAAVQSVVEVGHTTALRCAARPVCAGLEPCNIVLYLHSKNPYSRYLARRVIKIQQLMTQLRQCAVKLQLNAAA